VRGSRGKKNGAMKRNRFTDPIGKMKNGLLAFLALITVAGAVYLLNAAFKSAFVVRSIVFSGNTRLSDDELRTFSGLKGGENLLTLSGPAVVRKMEESRWIASVSIRRELPNRIIVKITETRPFALLDMKGRLFLVDNRGTMLEKLKQSTVPFLPVISGNPFREKEAFAEAIHLAMAIKNTGISAQKDHVEIIAHKPEELAANLDGILVKIGTGDYEEKLARLIQVENEIRKRQIPVDYIDLRFANRVVVKPVNEVIR
jgi:cell division protein FtsQ